jgi:hypothetical protein
MAGKVLIALKHSKTYQKGTKPQKLAVFKRRYWLILKIVRADSVRMGMNPSEFFFAGLSWFPPK